MKELKLMIVWPLLCRRGKCSYIMVRCSMFALKLVQWLTLQYIFFEEILFVSN